MLVTTNFQTSDRIIPLDCRALVRNAPDATPAWSAVHHTCALRHGSAENVCARADSSRVFARRISAVMRGHSGGRLETCRGGAFLATAPPSTNTARLILPPLSIVEVVTVFQLAVCVLVEEVATGAMGTSKPAAASILFAVTLKRAASSRVSRVPAASRQES